ncbi:Uncharacterised protein [Mycobacteroides abscessus]|nr:Uncharacterised protein [Mycobacteroides abscessus]
MPAASGAPTSGSIAHAVTSPSTGKTTYVAATIPPCRRQLRSPAQTSRVDRRMP